jgi:hypothetical protein
MLGEDGLDVQRELLGRTARVRREAEECMVYGTLEGEVDFMEKPQIREVRLKDVWRARHRVAKMPDIYGTVWKNLERTATAVTVGSARDSTTVLRFRVPAKGLRLIESPSTAGARYVECDDVGELTLPAFGLAFLRD